MLKTNMKIDYSQIKALTKAAQKSIAALPQDTLDQYKRLTPVRSGNARRNTRLNKNSIVADYPYAARLNDGHSNQAPDGMNEPTLEWFQKRIKKIFGGTL